MTSTHTIQVHTAPAYDVVIGPGLLNDCGDYLKPLLSGCRIAVITDDKVAPLYLETVLNSLRGAGFDACSHAFPAGEEHKTAATLLELLTFLAENLITRSDCLLALGGGVCGDMAGFAAAIYLRGIRCVQLPTTLLAAVDSSVGGKTAIDLPAGKNLVGAFLQPTAVLCDVSSFKTLPPACYVDGAAEAIKTGVLSGEELFSLAEKGGMGSDPADLIARCIRYKAGVVERDEREQGERRLLNLGHTVGHAIERCSHYTIPHGHAVAAGLAIIAKAADRLGWSDTPVAPRISRCLLLHGLPTGSSFSARQLAQAALSDKKRSGDEITLVIPRRIGLCDQKKIPVSQLEAVISAGLEV